MKQRFDDYVRRLKDSFIVRSNLKQSMKLRMLVEFYDEVRLVVIYFCFFEGVKVCKYGDFIGYVIEYYLEVLMRW